MSAVKKLQLAIVGFGRAGRIHAKNVLSNNRCVLKYLVEQESVIDRILPDVTACTAGGVTPPKLVANLNLSEILTDSEISGVIIASSTDTHEHIITECLKAGKNVMCEKPLGTTSEVISRHYALATENGCSLLCAFNRRFDPDLREAWRRIRSGELGKINRIKCMSGDRELPPAEYLKNSGGIFVDTCIHDLDAIAWLAGQRASSVYAAGGANYQCVRDAGDWDTVAVTLGFPDGCIGTVENNRNVAHGFHQAVEVQGDKGSLIIDNHYPSRVQVWNHSGRCLPPAVLDFVSRYKESYILELEHFLDTIEGVAVEVSAADVLAATKLAELCKASIATNTVMQVTQ